MKSHVIYSGGGVEFAIMSCPRKRTKILADQVDLEGLFIEMDILLYVFILRNVSE